MDGEVTCCITYECSRSDIHKPHISSDLTLRRTATLQHIQFPWKVHITCFKINNIIKINSVVNDYNHSLTLMIQKIASRFWKLTPEMMSDKEKYVIQGRMNSGSIYPLL